MCRIFAYLGPELNASGPLLEAEHSLKDQSQNAHEMTGSSVAGDGWGLAWFPKQRDSAPAMVKSILPLWSDLNAKTVAPGISSGSMVGHIRLASPGSEVCFLNTPLYLLDDMIYTINGELQPWPGAVARAIRGKLDGESEAAVQGATDGELFAALWRTCWHRSGSKDAGAALCAALAEARACVLAEQGSMKINVIVAGRRQLFAVKYGAPEESSSLYYLSGEPRWNNGTVVASEPLDDGPGWTRIAPSTLLRADLKQVKLEPIRITESTTEDRRSVA